MDAPGLRAHVNRLKCRVALAHLAGVLGVRGVVNINASHTKKKRTNTYYSFCAARLRRHINHMEFDVIIMMRDTRNGGGAHVYAFLIKNAQKNTANHNSSTNIINVPFLTRIFSAHSPRLVAVRRG